MLENQKGSGHIVVIVLIVLVLLGATGWFVWNNNRKSDNSEESNTSTSEENKDVEEQYVIPEGYTVYENDEIGFKFAYPNEWTAPVVVSDSDTALVTTLSDENLSSAGYIKGPVQVFSSPEASFKTNTQYKGAVVSPQTTDGSTAWIVESSGLGEIEVGEEYDAKILHQGDGLTVWEFPASHANSAWNTLVFEIDGTFVGIGSPLFNPSLDLSQEEFDASRKAFDNSLAEIAKTIRKL